MHTLLWKPTDVQGLGMAVLARVKPGLLWYSQESCSPAEPQMSSYFTRLFFHETEAVIKEQNLL